MISRHTFWLIHFNLTIKIESKKIKNTEYRKKLNKIGGKKTEFGEKKKKKVFHRALQYSKNNNN